jgi:hypothetical protein
MGGEDMSDVYTSFCHCISSMTDMEQDWCRRYLDNELKLECSGCSVVYVDENIEVSDYCSECKDKLFHPDADDLGPLPGFRWEIEGTNLYLISSEGGTDQAIEFLEYFLAARRPGGYQKFQWSHSSENPQVGSDGGGAAFVTDKGTTLFSTQDFLQQEQDKWDSSAGNVQGAKAPF